MFKESNKQTTTSIVSEGENKKKSFIDADPEAKNGENRIVAKNKFSLEYCRLNPFRNCYFIFGASGAGKSYVCKDIIKSYVKLNKDHKDKIYLISQKKEDETLDSLKYIKRINLNKIVGQKFEINKDLENSFFIFDDCESVDDPTIKEHIYFNWIKQILELGRSYKINCIVTSHLPHGKFNKLAIFESHYVISYLNSGAFRQTSYMLENYAGIDPKLIKKLKAKDSRWTMFHKNYPNFYVQEKELAKITE